MCSLVHQSWHFRKKPTHLDLSGLVLGKWGPPLKDYICELMSASEFTADQVRLHLGANNFIGLAISVVWGVFGPLTICWCLTAQCLVWRRTLSRRLVLGSWQAVNALGRSDYHLGGPVVQWTRYTAAIGPRGYLVKKKKKKVLSAPASTAYFTEHVKKIKFSIWIPARHGAIVINPPLILPLVVREIVIRVLKVFTAVSLEKVCFLSFKENFKKVIKTLPQQLS
jgi:hypothetical protein